MENFKGIPLEAVATAMGNLFGGFAWPHEVEPRIWENFGIQRIRGLSDVEQDQVEALAREISQTPVSVPACPEPHLFDVRVIPPDEE